MHRRAGARELSAHAARILGGAVPFEGICIVSMDPATLLPTGEFVENGLPDWAARRIAEIEIEGSDFNTFQTLARFTPSVGILSETTQGDLDRSVRHRELKRPNGHGDELRAALVTGSTMWGGISLFRGHRQPNFTAAEAATIAAVSPYLAEGLRRAQLFTTASESTQDEEAAVGVALVAPDNTITEADAAARRWLAELCDGAGQEALPVAVHTVVSRARRIATGEVSQGMLARSRVRTGSGQWLLLRGSTLGHGPYGQTALIVEPARPHELAPLIAESYGLTHRERCVVQLIAQGLSTNVIGDRLHLSPWTVQDHLKSIFEKVGVGTRGELVARLFFEHYVPSFTRETIRS
ncbi:LuxR C-terminal-related transcriptional regulator [Pseudonocardia adelaidensis]|uniref:LuxR C-terminal-related transcriptional regulator n=1 Tax=Pseudonocardia adelaidensis TaxID=648754 RepID=A0ABP9NNV0_9PSEU